jgi:hypothetical protein
MKVSLKREMNPDILRVLFVGPVDRCIIIRNAFLQLGRCRVTAVTSYLGLFLDIPRKESFDLVMIQQMSSLHEFLDSSAYIRRTWPCAKILVICAEAEVLDDPLYDDWVAPSHSLEVLLATIDRLIGCNARKEYGALSYQQLPVQSSAC